MAPTHATCLYQETRLNLEPAFPGSTISVTLPTTTSSTFVTRAQSKRSVVTESFVDQDEDAFSKRHLASEGAMYFRRHHSYPRSFLWRLLDGRQALEIQSVDLDQEQDNALEANLTLSLRFPSPVRPFGIAFADPEDRDALTVFAVTTANELYTLTLPRDFFTKITASEQAIGDWCKISSPFNFVTRVPYRLVALDAHQLLYTLDDGAVLYMKWDSGDGKWRESIYKEANWSGTVRRLMPWTGQETVRFDGGELQSSAAAAVAISPDHRHIFTICLNHRLRAWNVATGRPGVSTDLLAEPDHPNEKTASYFISPSQSTLMAIVDIRGGVDGAEYHVVTYSPKQHRFKIWGIRDADQVQNGIRDCRAEMEFIPPVDDLMNTTVWTLEEFIVVPGPAGWRGAEFWIRARSGLSSKVYSLKFDLEEEKGKLADVWKNDWVSVDSGPLTVEGLRQNPENPMDQDVYEEDIFSPGLSEKWLGFLFYPSRFTSATLETALVIFRRGHTRGRGAQTSSTASLQERVTTAIAFAAGERQGSSTDYSGYEEMVAAQWQAYYALVRDLHKRRGDSLSLVFDHQKDMPWLVSSDYLSAIRQCSEAEIISLNPSAIAPPSKLTGPIGRIIGTPQAWELSRLVNAAASFRKNLPDTFQSQFSRIVENELLQSRSVSVIDRMELLEQESDLCRQVSDDDLALLVDELGMDVRDLTNETFMEAIRALNQEEQGHRKDPKQVTRFGLNALLRTTQESLHTNTGVLLDLLVLVLFMQFEEDLSEHFDAVEVFVEIMYELKDYSVLKWLAATIWSQPAPAGPASSNMMEHLGETFNSRKLPLTQTVLEGIYGTRTFDRPLPRGLKAMLLTYWSRTWTCVVFSEKGTFDSSLEEIMSILLLQGQFVLAQDFSKFLSDSSWSTYLKGRLHIALGEYHLASIDFQKAAYNLALGAFSLDDADSNNIVHEHEKESFSEGLPKYYLHVLGLFERKKAYSFVADFAHLALRSFMGEEEGELKSEILSRLFSASINTARFDDAYSALTRYTDIKLQDNQLKTLVKSMIERSQIEDFLKLPFLGLADDVDSILSAFCQTSLNLSSGPPYHQILYSFRISRGDYRGAASVLYERLQRLKSSSSKIHDPADDSLSQCYLMILNTLSSVGSEDAYILVNTQLEAGIPKPLALGKAKKMLRRQIVTLDTLRKEYQAELDRVAAIESGQFPLMEIDDPNESIL